MPHDILTAVPTSFLPGVVTPYTQSMNLTAERELPANLMLQASYVSLLGRKNPIGNQQNPAVAIDAGGNFVVVWENYDVGGIYSRRFDINGNPLSATDVRVTSSTTGRDSTRMSR